uniref:Major facilitator superfamily (MFS) profile domain-containing protein n=1 Tax=Fusarium oxysporum (strain Fo5176) TaxID=660025 RepID=A0A0D2Y3B1_FUSOF
MVPPLGPIISGYATRYSWRLTFWVGLGISGVFLPLVYCLPETYAPIIKKKHRVDPEAAEKQQPSFARELKVIFLRPFVMAARVYQLSSGEVGLTFLPTGSIVALGLFLGYSSYHSSAMKAGIV